MSRPLRLALSLLLLAPVPAAQDLLVASRNTDEILRYAGSTGAFVEVFASGGGLDNPVGLTFGPDQHLYVSSANNSLVLRYDGTTGAFIDIFASVGLNSPRQLNFGPDGDLYVANGANNQIVRYDGQSGAFKGLFASGGNLQGPTSFTFGPDGDLYVVSVINDLVKRYDGKTGAYLGNFVSSLVDGPHDVAFGPDGRFYVTNANQTRLRVFDPQTGAFIKNLLNDPALSAPLGMAWDGNNRIYVANQGGNEVRRYHANTGAFIDSFVAPSSGGLDAPLFLTFFPRFAGPFVQPTRPGVAGRYNTVRVSGFEPGRMVFLSTGVRSMPYALACGAQVALTAPILLRFGVSDESGALVVGGTISSSLAGLTFDLQAFAPRSCESTPLASVTF
jgi:WD40 repeat protein